jgi:ADP-ribosylglycohydrolase/catechol 2,3-dioxygenase-like lactoylglutathione lyase family enzyme
VITTGATTNELMTAPRDRIEGAFLGAAYGDALGWPNEARAKRVGPPRKPSPELAPWVRRAGGRFGSHELSLAAGAYSDDTQLLLAVARAVKRGDNWHEWLTGTELPTWLAYERGGGGAVKRAAATWQQRRPPWTLHGADLARYYDAGGNGVAMRSLPHCVKHTRSDARLLADVLRDGFSTHGHPEALIGGLLYASALVYVLQHRGTLGYGDLIDHALAEHRVWETPPTDIADGIVAIRASDDGRVGKFEASWRQTVEKAHARLDAARAGLDRGALAEDRVVMETIGCFDPKVSGAGTVAAVAAIFLASHHAVDPLQGVVEAAFALGADTDTTASMTGALLGALHGTDWLMPFARKVQDEGYVRSIMFTPSSDESKRVPPVTKARVRSFMISLGDTPSESGVVQLPDGRDATVSARRSLPTETRSSFTDIELRTSDGQTVYVEVKTMPTRGASQDELPLLRKSSTIEAEQYIAPAPLEVGAAQGVGTLVVSDLDQSVQFWTRVVGLRLLKKDDSTANIANVVLLARADPSSEWRHPRLLGNGCILILVDPDTAVQVSERVERARAVAGDRRASLHGRTQLFFRDPDGNLIQLLSKTSGAVPLPE